MGRSALLYSYWQAFVARNTEIAICFKQAPYPSFKDTPVASLRPNWLVLSIAPDEGISLQFEVKRPGPVVDLAAVKMDFRYNGWFPKEPNVGYETLLYDVMIGDPTLFMRADMVEKLGVSCSRFLMPGPPTARRSCRPILQEARDRAKRTRFWRVITEAGEASTPLAFEHLHDDASPNSLDQDFGRRLGRRWHVGDRR